MASLPTELSGRGLRSEGVRQSNLSAILERLHVAGPASRSELVSDTGLTRSAVGALVGELVHLGLVREERSRSDGTPGRPSPIVVPRGDDNVVLAMEVLVDSIAVAAVGLGGTRLRSIRSDRPRERIPVERTVQDLVALTRQVCDTLPAATRLHGVGVAVAGLVRAPECTVTMGPNIGWVDVDIGRLLADELAFGVPIAVMNDGDLGSVAEARRGAAAGLSDVVYVSCEVGVGGGIMASGAAIAGVAGFAGEIGHLPVNLDGELCKCGARGCWETEVGEEALLRRAGWPVDGGRRAVREVTVAAERGDPVVLAALQEHGRWVGIGLAALINLFNPQAIVLGGFLGPALPHLDPALHAELDARALAPAVAAVEVFASALGADAPLLGAAELAWQRSLRDVGSHEAMPIGRVAS